MKLLLCLLAVLTGAIAAPLSPDETSKTFKLKSRVLSPPNPSFNNLYLEPYHIYPGANYAVLAPKSATDPGIVGYLNGTAADFAHGTTDLVFTGNPAPYGFIIDAVNATSSPVLINAGTGTAGVFIDRGVVGFHGPVSGGFYACNETLEFGPAVQLFYKPTVIGAPTGCSDVELAVESAE